MMPYETHYIPPPRDLSLPLLADLPPYVAVRPVGPDDWNEAHGKTPDGATHHYYHCPCCKGWVEGVPNAFPMQQRGTEFCCIRCGERIGIVARLT